MVMKKKILLIFICNIFLCTYLPCQNVLKIRDIGYDFYSVPLEEFTPAFVTRVIDGDTIEVEIIRNEEYKLNRFEKIRFIGVDTPETKHPTKKMQYYGKEAYEYTKNRLEGSLVYLLFENNIRDKYNRLLCYIIEEDYNLFNYELIYYGFSYAYLNYPFTYSKTFIQGQKEAEINKYGMWSK